MLYAFTFIEFALFVWKAVINALLRPVTEESMGDAWIKQQARVKEAIAQAKSTNASEASESAESDDEWVIPWIRQQQRARDAIAKASAGNRPTEPDETDDEWLEPWLRQQARVKEAIARATRENREGRDR